jgi:phosphatidylglycerophosphate synthase
MFKRMPSKNKNFNVPNTLTVLRIILVIPFMCYYLNGKIKPAIIVLLIAGLTDALDGFIARRFHQQTELGQLLDPISDKVIQGLVAISLAIRHPVLLPVLLIFVIKEGIMLVGGGRAAEKRQAPLCRQVVRQSGNRYVLRCVRSYFGRGYHQSGQSLFPADCRAAGDYCGYDDLCADYVRPRVFSYPEQHCP